MPRRSSSEKPHSRFVWEPGDVRVLPHGLDPVAGAVAAVTAAKVKKANPYHDERGRFTTSEAAAAAGADSTSIDTPERNKIRAAIVQQMLQGAVKGRRAFVVIGGPGSGKSSLRADLLASQWNAVTADPDAAKRLLPEWNTMEHAGASMFLHEESSQINRDVITSAMREGDNLVIPKVGDNPQKIEQLVSALDKHGYTVTLSLVDLPTEEAVRRNEARKAGGGHGPSAQYVRDVDSKPAFTYRALKTHPGVDFYEHFSSAGPPSDPTRLVERGANPHRRR